MKYEVGAAIRCFIVCMLGWLRCVARPCFLFSKGCARYTKTTLCNRHANKTRKKGRQRAQLPFRSCFTSIKKKIETLFYQRPHRTSINTQHQLFSFLPSCEDSALCACVCVLT